MGTTGSRQEPSEITWLQIILTGYSTQKLALSSASFFNRQGPIMMSLQHSLKRASPRGLAARFMSVINLSDMDATEKFTQINHKSILYFTATWYVTLAST